MGETEKTRKETHTTKLTKISKTKRQKYGMNEILNFQSNLKFEQLGMFEST
jgi:hypothetical protein